MALNTSDQTNCLTFLNTFEKVNKTNSSLLQNDNLTLNDRDRSQTLKSTEQVLITNIFQLIHYKNNRWLEQKNAKMIVIIKRMDKMQAGSEGRFICSTFQQQGCEKKYIERRTFNKKAGRLRG